MTVTSPAPDRSLPAGEAIRKSDASCRDAVLPLFWFAAAWAVAGCLLGLLSSLKFHGPGIGSGAMLTYGRVYPASNFLLLYGALAQAGIGVMLWLIARLAGTTLRGGWAVLFGGLLWNVGMVSGAGAILTGNATGIDGFEIPRGPALMLFAAYCAMTLPGWFTMLRREEKPYYVSEWFLLAALFWFPWVFSTAVLFLHVFPARGVLQYVIAQWHFANLARVWLALIAYASLFYFVPKLARRPLHSGGSAALTFWMTLFFASWTAVPPGAPVPAWMPGVSSFAALVSLVPMLAAVSNVRQTLGDQSATLRSQPAGLCFVVAVPCLLIGGLLHAGASIRGVGEAVAYTFFGMGVHTLFLGGFAGLSILGAILFAVPRLTDGAWCSEGRVSICSKLAVAAVLVIGVSFVLAGMLQGSVALDPSIPFDQALKRAMGPFRLSTLGWLAAALSAAILLGLLTQVCVRVCAACCVPAFLRPSGSAGKAKSLEVAA